MHINSCHSLELDLFDLGKKFKILVPIPILYYSQHLILEEGNNTLYRWELMVWEGWKEQTVCVHIVVSAFPTWSIYHAELDLSLRVI